MTLDEYIEVHTTPENEALQAITRDTYVHVLNPHMLSGHVQGRVLSMISHMLRPRRILELGTFTGYSALCLAEGLPEDGRLITIEHNDELEETIRRNFARSPLSDRIELRIGDAVEIISNLRFQNSNFDLVFIDADKREYSTYLDLVSPLVPVGGFILADNTLWDGHIIDPAYDKDKQTQGLRAFNDKVAADKRFEQVILPLRDGLTILRKVMMTMLLLFSFLGTWATTYSGRVVDQNGQPIPYATVYPEIQPELGTATNNDGFFSFEADLPDTSRVILSFIGYEKQTVPACHLSTLNLQPSTFTLTEQPIALEETVVAAKASKQRNKRKQMATLLHAVYVQLEKEFPDQPAHYQVVSDVRMQSEGATWGMEQMIASIVVLPESGQDGKDSVQFQGQFCKRFFDARKRAQADSILAGETIERMEKKSKEKFIRKAANAVDSGVVVHRALFAMGNMRYDFEQAMNDLRHWTVSNESEGETVLTHTQKISKYLGCFQMTFQRHYIVDSHTYAVRRFSEHADVKITIPFGVKLNADQLQMLNLVCMGDNEIQKFRLQKMRGTIDYNTIYQRRNGLVYTLEKNMLTNAKILGSKQTEIPIIVKATQRVTSLQTEDVQPLKRSQMTNRLPRQIVEIY